MSTQTQSWTRLPLEIRQQILSHLLDLNPTNPKIFYGVSYTFGQHDCLQALHTASTRVRDELQAIQDSGDYEEGSDDGFNEDEVSLAFYAATKQKGVVETAISMLEMFERVRTKDVPWWEWEMPVALNR